MPRIILSLRYILVEIREKIAITKRRQIIAMPASIARFGTLLFRESGAIPKPSLQTAIDVKGNLNLLLKGIIKGEIKKSKMRKGIELAECETYLFSPLRFAISKKYPEPTASVR